MIILTDINGIVYSAMNGGEPDLSGTDYTGAYEIQDTMRVRDCINRPLSDFTLINTLATQPGTHDQLNSVKSERASAINKACRLEIISGFESSALGSPHQYPFKEEDQSNLTATFLLANQQGVSKPFKCWDSSGVSEYRMHTFAQIVQVGADAETHKMAALVKANTLKAQIAAATTAAEVEAIVW